jgi:hypothetical protein
MEYRDDVEHGSQKSYSTGTPNRLRIATLRITVLLLSNV